MSLKTLVRLSFYHNYPLVVTRHKDDISTVGVYRKTGVRSRQYWLEQSYYDSNRSVHHHRYLRHSHSVQTFSVTNNNVGGPGGHLVGQGPHRPHSVDLGRVSYKQYSYHKLKLTDEFRRAGIGTCLEGKKIGKSH